MATPVDALSTAPGVGVAHAHPTAQAPLRRDVVSFARRTGRTATRRRLERRPDQEAYLVSPRRGPRSTSLDPQWRIDAEALFGREAPLIVEIGSGDGEAVLAAARDNPGQDFLAVEVYRPGVARTLQQAARGRLGNVRVLEADAMAVLGTSLPPGSVREIRVFFPDPWPKHRHHKRRLVQRAMVFAAADVLAPGGVLRMCTDWPGYAEQMLRECASCEALANPHAVTSAAEAPLAGLAPRFDGRPVTRFERKALAHGREVHDLTFVKGPGPTSPATPAP